LAKENFNITKDILKLKKRPGIGKSLVNSKKFWHISFVDKMLRLKKTRSKRIWKMLSLERLTPKIGLIMAERI